MRRRGPVCEAVCERESLSTRLEKATTAAKMFEQAQHELGKQVLEHQAEIERLRKPGWACRACGFTGEGFRTIRYDAGDLDVECPECESVETGELPEVLRMLAEKVDDATAELARQREHTGSALGELLALPVAHAGISRAIDELKEALGEK